jgi:hypothetical protein
MRSLMTCTPYSILFSDHIENELDRACSMYEGEERRVQGFGGDLRERDHMGDPGIDGRIILIWVFMKWDVGVWTGWLRIGIGGGHL